MAPPPTDEAQLAALRKERADFESRVRRNEQLAAANPSAYQTKLKGLVAVGYAFIGLMLALAVGLTGGILYMMINGHFSSGGIKIMVAGGAITYAILRSLWVKIDPPEGYLLTRERFPKLWAEVESIADRLNAPRPHEIRLDEVFNASAAQWPRFGMLGGYRQTLTLGLPLLAGLSPDEARGVIAHEFGHFSGAHGKFGVWIYRVDRTWNQLGQNLGRVGWAGFIMRPFANWFFPRFHASSFAIRRQHEFEADRAAVEIVGAETMARTLTRLSPLGEHLQRAFWKPYEREIARTGTPAPGLVGRIVGSMQSEIDVHAAKRRVAFALAQATDYDDTHPSLTDRLKSIGVSAPTDFDPIPSPSAADEFFGDGLKALEREFDAFFEKQMFPVWQALANRRREIAKRVQELERGEQAGTLNGREQAEIVYLRTERDGVEDTVPAFRELYERLPDNPHAAYLLGSALLEQNNEEGIALVEAAVKGESSYQNDVRSELAAFYARQGEAEQVSVLREEAQDAYDRALVAQSALTGLDLKDDLSSPDISTLDREKLEEILPQIRGLQTAYLFQKRLPGTGELRHYLVLFPNPMRYLGEDILAHFVKELSKFEKPAFPLSVTTVPSPKPWRKRLDEIENALIFSAKEK